MPDRLMLRRDRDRLYRWALHAFFVLAIVAICMGVWQLYLSRQLHHEMVALRQEQSDDKLDRKRRLETWEQFRSQLTDALVLRDGEIRLIKQRIELIEAQHRLDRVQGQATRDRAGQR